MNGRWSLFVFSALLLAGCEKDEPIPEKSGSLKKSSRKQVSLSISHPAGASTFMAREDLLEKSLEKLHFLPDEQFAGAVQNLLERNNEHDDGSILTSMYDVVELRPSFIRLPILLELARRDTGATGLRATILSELQESLEEDHGESWTDWALALSELLATKEGFLPTDASTED